MKLSNTEKQIIELFVNGMGCYNTMDICRKLGTKYPYTNQLLWGLNASGLLNKTRRVKSNRGFVYYHLNEENEEVQGLIKSIDQ
ncbi:MAG TPA: hypothetical protein VI790_01640 [Candidatus Nanoarchaeia archaeon]|nr:hypothetical protein [Candidatus Nanoarchaeia archaeon]